MLTRRPTILPRALIFIALGFLLASLIGNVGAAAGTLLVLPLLFVKMMFVFFFFGFMLRFVGGRGPRGWRGRQRRPDHSGPSSRREPTEAEREWEQALKTAREEVDELFPDPRD